jgi:hypothetical protein
MFVYSITATLSEFGTHPEDRVQFTMFHIGGPSTGSSSFSILVGIGSSMHLDGLEAVTIFMNVPRDIGLKNLSVSLILDPGSSVQTTEHWRNMPTQRGVNNLISNDHDLFMNSSLLKLKAILSWGMMLFLSQPKTPKSKQCRLGGIG